MAKKKREPEHFHRHDEAQAHAEQIGGTVERDRIWVVYPEGREASADTTEPPETESG